MRKLSPLMLIALLLASCASGASPPLPAAENAQAYIERGKSLSEEGRYLEAVDNFSAAVELEPQNADAYFLRGRAHYDYACQVVKDATGGAPENVAFLPDEAVQHLEQAVGDYTSAIELDPQNPKAYNNRANAYASLGQEEGALDDYNSALELDSTLTLTYFNRGLIRYRSGDHEGAIVDLEKYLELAPDAEDRAQVEDVIQQMREGSPPAP